MIPLTVDAVHTALATLRTGHKGKMARLPNNWLMCLYRNYTRDRWELEIHVGGAYRYTWSVRPEHLLLIKGRCPYGSDFVRSIAPDILDAMAGKLFARLAAIEADYLPIFRLFKSWPVLAVRFRVLTPFDAVDVSGWQVRFADGWYTLATLIEREDIPALIARCEALGRERFLCTGEGSGVSIGNLESQAGP